MSLDKQERATVLAALRYFQRHCMSAACPPDIADIATDHGSMNPLDAEDIDALCERINITGVSHDRR